MLSKDIDNDFVSSRECSNWKEIKKNIQTLFNMFRHSQIFRTCIYLLLTGLLVPSFGMFNYYY